MGDVAIVENMRGPLYLKAFIYYVAAGGRLQKFLCHAIRIKLELIG